MDIYRNARFLCPDGNFARGDIACEGGRIVRTGDCAAEYRGARIYDMTGLTVLPGLVDIHVHGAAGCDVTDASPDEIRGLARFFSRRGVTAFFPTTVAAGRDRLLRAARNIRAAAEDTGDGAAIAGIHFEGPFISPLKRGCQDAGSIRLPSREEFDELAEAAGGLRIRITVAPELEGAEEFISYARGRGASVSLGHTDADEKTALAGLDAGADSFTHLFNAMRGINHREPGAAGAGLVSGAYTELICDGVHIHPDIIKLVCAVKSPDRVVAITDAMNAAGCPDGNYTFCGAQVVVKDGRARTPEGNLAGSTLMLAGAVRNFTLFAGVTVQRAALFASANPARAALIADRAGSIAPGRFADLAIFGADLRLKATVCRGTYLEAPEKL